MAPQSKQRWIAIYGKVDVIDGEIVHIPVVSTSNTGKAGPSLVPHSLVRSNIEFEQGTISAEFMLDEPEARCQIGLDCSPPTGVLYGGLNVLGTPYGFGLFRNGEWEPVLGAGLGSELPLNEWLEVSITVNGSNIDLHFQGVKVASTIQRIRRAPISLLMQSNNNVKVRNVKVATQDPICFVVMQFTDEFNELYSEVIKPTCEAFGYRVVRADDFYTSGLIIDDITRSIQECTLVIADVTPNNANVFYELGYAHGIGKPTILLSDRKRDRLPFDISGFRTIFYDNTIGGKGVVEARLKMHLESLD